jgi:predicted O-methyltransferase YrrM
MHLLRTLQHSLCDKLDGPISSEEGAHLAYLASQIPQGGIVVEIGTNEGKSASFMGFGLLHAGNTTARVHCVDLWDLGGPTQQVNYRGPYKEGRFLQNCVRLGLTDILVPHKAESVAFAKDWNLPIDLLFIDAGHTYEAVSADYYAWRGFLKPGGCIAFHDYMDMWPGVKKLIDEEVIPDMQYTDWEIVYRLVTAKKAG